MAVKLNIAACTFMFLLTLRSLRGVAALPQRRGQKANPGKKNNQKNPHLPFVCLISKLQSLLIWAFL